MSYVGYFLSFRALGTFGLAMISKDDNAQGWVFVAFALFSDGLFQGRVLEWF